jgi:hypothetical protein
MQKAIAKMACIWIPKIQNPHGFKKNFAKNIWIPEIQNA